MGALNQSSCSIRELFSQDVDFLAAVHLAVMARPKNSTSIAQPVKDLLESGSVGELRLRPVVGAYERNLLRIAVVGVESPGASNLMLVPFELDSQVELEGGLLALRHARELSGNYGISLSQVIGPDRQSKWDDILQEAGFIRLTNLVYMTRTVCNDTANVSRRLLEGDQRWVTYSVEAEPLFCEAIGRSYVQSMDCPELTSVRTVQQSLSSHRAVGVFDPATWFVLDDGHQPQGVLLLSKVCREPVMEIVYMGVSQPARGSGIADLLMDHALHITAEHATSLILAVDVRNEPAKRLYARWGFVEIARRAAWIANMCGIGR
jgi:ribosomal protein S18 acetylase RimI-like enzyme